ncbi:MAG: ParB N-terminal domain-containing protein [Acinetobacter pittii]
MTKEELKKELDAIRLRVTQKTESSIIAEQQNGIEGLQLSCDEHLVEVNIPDLKKPSYNHRIIVDSRLQQLTDSLERYGFIGGIFIHAESFNVIDGWHRCEQWQLLGQSTIPCYKIYCTLQVERDLHLRLNQQAATFDLQELGLDFEGVNLLDYGFTEEDLKPEASYTPSEKLSMPKPHPENTTKLITIVQTSTMVQLKECMADNGLKTTGELLDFLFSEQCAL